MRVSSKQELSAQEKRTRVRFFHLWLIFGIMYFWDAMWQVWKDRPGVP